MPKYNAPPASLTPGSIVDAYLRDSGGEGQDRSVDSQLKELRAYCAQYRLSLRNIYKDVARSGKSTVGRAEFDQMIQDVEEGASLPDGLIIWDYARFARNTKDAVYNIALIENNGVVIHSLTDDIPDGEYRDLIRFVRHMGNEAERKKNSKAVRRELLQLVRETKAMFGVPPRGFKREPLPPTRNERTGEMRVHHKWIPDPEMVPLIRRAFEMRAKGATVEQIRTATGLYKTPRGYTEFFCNRLFIGELEFGDVLITDYCDPIIDRETWEEVQRIAQRRKLPQNNEDHPRRSVSSFILSGMLHCQECGSPMNGYSIKQWDYYVCSRRKSKRDCSSRRIPKEPIEQEIIRLLEDRLLSLENLLAVQAHVRDEWDQHSTETDKLRNDEKKKLDRVQVKIRNITKAISDHGHSSALLNQLALLEQDEKEIKFTLERLERHTPPREYTRPQLAQIAEQIKQDLHSGENQKIRGQIRGLVERIIAKRTDNEIQGLMYCIPINYQVFGTVPPRGSTPKTLFEILIPIRGKRAPLVIR